MGVSHSNPHGGGGGELGTLTVVSGRALYQPENAEVGLQLCNRAPWEDLRVLPLVWGVGRQLVRPSATTNQGKEGAPVEPRQMNLGLRARATANDNAGIAGERHQEIPGISHSAREDNRGGPIRRRHVIRRNDAEHQAIRLDGTLSGDPCRWASTPAHDSDAQLGQGLACVTGKLVSARVGLSAAENTDLRFAVGNRHGECGVRPGS